MLQKKRVHKKEKSSLHPRSKHRGRYDFKQLIETCPELARFVSLNRYEDESIDFSDPESVKMLNKALLKHFYQIDSWNIPDNYLCPPIPGRADYMHHIADLLAVHNHGKIPRGDAIKCLDIGVGANCIYPIIGNKEYGWSFIGSDIDPIAIESAGKIVAMDPALSGKIEFRLQQHTQDIFAGIIQEGERFDLTISNPPFHASLAEARAGSLRKVTNLSRKKITKPLLNFGGQNRELWCEGGEKRFLQKMIRQSKQFSSSCFWFSSLISKQSNLKDMYKQLKNVDAKDVKTMPMGQGNKSSRVVAWTFLTIAEQKKWIEARWE